MAVADVCEDLHQENMAVNMDPHLRDMAVDNDHGCPCQGDVAVNNGCKDLHKGDMAVDNDHRVPCYKDLDQTNMVVDEDCIKPFCGVVDHNDLCSRDESYIIKNSDMLNCSL